MRNVNKKIPRIFLNFINDFLSKETGGIKR